MRRIAHVVVAGFAAASCAAPVSAGPYSDDLAKCLVASTSAADKSGLVQWMFAAASLHPDVRWMTNLTDHDRQELNQKMATLVETLLTQSCLAQTKDALKYEGLGTM